MRRGWGSGAGVVTFGVLAFACAWGQKAGETPQAFELSGEFAGTHDPSIGVDHGKYYVFATGAAYPPRPAGAPAWNGPPAGAGTAGAATGAPGAPGAPGAGAVGAPSDAGTPGAAAGAPGAAAAAGTAGAVGAAGGGAGKNATARPAAIGQFPVRCSIDLHDWKRCGEVFPAIPKWIQEMSPKTRELWAPDISFFDGLYHLYYSFSLFGKNTSGLALATNETLDASSPRFKWVDRGLVLRSTEQDDFNAIDPNLVLDAKGEAWLAFGSFWTGIKMRHLDRKTGLLSVTDTRLYSLASRSKTSVEGPRNPDLPPDTEAIEAPFILRHGDFYYLFVSWDLCCRGLKSTYRTMVGRAKEVTGPYVDREGKPMLDGGGTAVLAGNAKWLGPGGESLLHLPDEDLIVFHAYSAVSGRPSLHISSVGWKDGWPAASLEGDGK